jgi:hypothetical protein
VRFGGGAVRFGGGAVRFDGGAVRFRRRGGAVPELGRCARGAYAVAIAAAAPSPSSSVAVSRILNFCTLPVTVIGKESTNLM